MPEHESPHEFEHFVRAKLLEVGHITSALTNELEKVHTVVERVSRQISDKDGLQTTSVRQEERICNLSDRLELSDKRVEKLESANERLVWWLITTSAGLVISLGLAIAGWVMNANGK